MDTILSQRELRRYIKQITLPEIGIKGQEKLKKAKVLIVGAGGIGAPVLQYLCATGIGEVGLVEHDYVDEQNLQRQILYGEKDIGKLKTVITKEILEKQNSSCIVDVINLKFSKNNALKIIEKYNIIVDATDNFSSRYLINDACSIRNKVLVYGAIYKYEGQVSVFNYNNGPGLRCLFPETPLKHEAADPERLGIYGLLSGIIGLYMANEVVKVITGLGETLSGKLLLFDVRNYSNYIFSFPKNPVNFEIRDIENVDYKN